MNLRKAIYFSLVRLRGQRLGAYYRKFWQEDQEGISRNTTREQLIDILSHCQQSVPYYAEVMRSIPESFLENPESYLQKMPVLTKAIIRERFEDLKSIDLHNRKWYYNTSGGSTGEPVRFIQDWDYAAKSGAIKLLYSKLAGCEPGEFEIHLWNSSRDLTKETEKLSSRMANWIENRQFVSVYRMTPDRFREIIQILNTKKPKLIVSYAGSITELAKFAEKEGLDVVQQKAIITSAGTLHSHMRDQIEKVFRCRVFNRYGSREVGDIACERPGYKGLWVAPWGCYVEIVDSSGRRVPDGEIGEILVTSFKNYAMPLIRYRIQDIGTLLPEAENGRSWKGQFLQEVLGRSNDLFINTKDQTIPAGAIQMFLYFKDWIVKYQFVQKTKNWIVVNIVTSGIHPPQTELDEIADKVRFVMEDDCQVDFNFVDDIQPTSSGKNRFFISEVSR